jgi:RNA recognition motif-containing protein
MKLFVGGLNFGTDSDALRRGFETFGGISEASVVSERDTGRSRGFGFVTFDSRTDGEAAIEGMNGKEFEGRTLNVNEARERPPRGNGGASFQENSFGRDHASKGNSRRSSKSDRW